MEDKLVRKLGSEKAKLFYENFDTFCDSYKDKAINEGYDGDLVFKKEHGKIIIFVEI